MELITRTISAHAVASEMFGVNALYDLNTTEDGTIRAGFSQATEAINATNLRFPGGLVEHYFNVVQLDDGGLRSELVAFLNSVRDANADGGDTSVTIVLPAKTGLPGTDYSAFVRLIVEDYSDVVSGFEIGNEYSIGAVNPNGILSTHPEEDGAPAQLFATNETNYGQQANVILEAIRDGIAQAGGDFDPVVLLQMSDISGSASAFKGTNDHASADREILSHISQDNIATVDGIVGHYYYNKNHDDGDSEAFVTNWRELRSFDERLAIWQTEAMTRFGAAQADKDLYFTEWNTNIRTLDQFGLKGASVLAEQFEQMVRLGADGAYAWPLQHNTATALAGHYRDEGDNVDLSPSAAVLSILSDVMVQANDAGQPFHYADIEARGENAALEVNTFGAQYQTLFTISNRSYDTVSETFSLDSALAAASGYRIYIVGIEAASSDGLAIGGNAEGAERLGRRVLHDEDRAALYDLPFFDTEDARHTKIVGGRELTYLISPEDIVAKTANPTSVADYWFLSEPDVHADMSYAEGAFDGVDTDVSFTLNPFEVAILVVDHAQTLEGLTSSETLEGGALGDNILGRDGDDLILGHAGDDTLKGGWGNDTLDGGSGHSVLNGGYEDDLFIFRDGSADVEGGEGIDTVSFEHAGAHMRLDLLYASLNTRAADGSTFENVENVIGTIGRDNIRGTMEDNLLQGGRNVDFLFGRRGNDTLDGGTGDDVLFGGVGQDVLNGGVNRDRAQYSEALEAVRVDLMNPGTNTGEAAGDVFISIEDLAGSRYSDALLGDLGANRLFGREGSDLLIGRQGDDYLNGGSNNDTLGGGQGDDVMRGGHGADLFIFSQGEDIVEDFAIGTDLFAIHKAGAHQVEASQTTQLGDDLLLDLGGGDTVLFHNVDHDDFWNHYGA